MIVWRWHFKLKQVHTRFIKMNFKVRTSSYKSSSWKGSLFTTKHGLSYSICINVGHKVRRSEKLLSNKWLHFTYEVRLLCVMLMVYHFNCTASMVWIMWFDEINKDINFQKKEEPQYYKPAKLSTVILTSVAMNTRNVTILPD